MMNHPSPKYALVVTPLALGRTLTYALPPDIASQVQIGSRVIIPLKSKFFTGIVVGFPMSVDGEYEVKDVEMLLDPHPIIRYPQLKLWDWIAEYYLCSLGEVYRAALPTGLKIESETEVTINDDFEETEDCRLTKREADVMGLLVENKGKLSVGALSRSLKSSDITRIVNNLLEKGAITVSETLNEKFHARKVKMVRLLLPMTEALECSKGAARQENILLAMAELSTSRSGNLCGTEVERDVLMKKAEVPSMSTLDTMRRKGIIEYCDKVINRFSFNGFTEPKLPGLSQEQNDAYLSIREQWKEKQVVLLHGVTSSGKTEIYIHLIADALEKGKRAFMLVPEIALTTQLTSRLQACFGEKVLIYHSKFTDSERVDVWKKLLETNDPCVIVGARSSVFLPFGDLGVVIVDEEHEPSYKQSDPAPRYNARDVAIVLAMLHGARTLLGSATPAIETRYKAESGKFGLVELMKRYGDAQLPHVSLVDVVSARRNHLYRAPFTFEMLQKAGGFLSEGNQAIFFLNRRGFAPVARCAACDWSPRCTNCDVGMTYHKSRNMLECHYCGMSMTLPVVCPQCGEPKVEILGFGTERVEDALAENFPDKKVLRMDLDTTRNKDGYQKIINEFSHGKADILIGTQMVTKGLDFKGVKVVGVLNADLMLNQPDFRASERTFNMLEQVAGRAGRHGKERGEVIIQTGRTDHPVMEAVRQHDYFTYYAREIEERRRFRFPPFSRIITIYLRHKDSSVVHDMARDFSNQLFALLGNRVKGPFIPLVSRVKTYYIRQIMIKVETEASIAHVKEILRDVHADSVRRDRRRMSVHVYYDVDPV